jgi:hypothetical protein
VRSFFRDLLDGIDADPIAARIELDLHQVTVDPDGARQRVRRSEEEFKRQV